MKLKKTSLVLLLVLAVLSCNQESDDYKSVKTLNTFSMIVDEQLWEPSLLNNDSCYSTFNCEWSALDDNAFYTISAYKDAQFRTDHSSENIFMLQIMNVHEPGEYKIDGTINTLSSYACFILNDSKQPKVYQNMASKPYPVVIVQEILPDYQSNHYKGVKGTFDGILYNQDDLKDSIIINNCSFSFQKVNWRNNCQCPE